jgi:hypothetical protein
MHKKTILISLTTFLQRGKIHIIANISARIIRNHNLVFLGQILTNLSQIKLSLHFMVQFHILINLFFPGLLVLHIRNPKIGHIISKLLKGESLAFLTDAQMQEHFYLLLFLEILLATRNTHVQHLAGVEQDVGVLEEVGGDLADQLLGRVHRHGTELAETR